MDISAQKPDHMQVGEKLQMHTKQATSAEKEHVLMFGHTEGHIVLNLHA